MNGKKINLRLLVACLVLPLAVGGLSALLSADGMAFFMQSVLKPPLNPPPWLFGVVWTVLFILMGIASYLVITSGREQRLVDAALKVYGIQLIFNFAWSPIFFNLKSYLFAFIWLIALFFLVTLNAVYFGKISKAGGLLFIPYALWVAFAGYLNLSIYLLNRSV